MLDEDKSHGIAAPGSYYTYSGILFNIYNPTKEMFRLRDVAHCLAIVNRWNGCLCRPYSVAEHLVRGHDTCEGQLALEYLIHDFGETHYQDLIRPIKYTMGDEYIKLEDSWQEQIHELIIGRKEPHNPASVKMIDNRMWCTEARDLGNYPPWWSENMPFSFTIPKTEKHWTVWEDALLKRLKLHLSEELYNKLY